MKMATGTQVAVLGLRDTGFLSALCLHEKGYRVFASDLADTEDVRENVSKLTKRGIPAECGKHSFEAILAAAPDGAKAYFYRSAAGHEIDLVLELAASRRWAYEFKKSLSPAVEKGFHIACADIKAERRILVYSGHESYPGSGGVEVMSLSDAVKK